VSDDASEGGSASAWVIKLEPIEVGPDKAAGEDQGTIETFLGRQNRIQLGKPRYRTYVAELLEQGSQIPADIERQVRDGFDIQHVTTSLTLLPDRGCAFVSVDFSIELLTAPREGQDVPRQRPIVREIKPHEVVYESAVRETSKTGYEVGGQAEGGVGKLLAKLTGENSFQRDGKQYVRALYGYGVNFSEAGWRLAATAERELAGDFQNLELIVQVPTGARLHGRFHVAAEVAVEVAADRWLTRVFGPSQDDTVVQATYPLSD
jgi:hypothetical protein